MITAKQARLKVKTKEQLLLDAREKALDIVETRIETAVAYGYTDVRLTGALDFGGKVILPINYHNELFKLVATELKLLGYTVKPFYGEDDSFEDVKVSW